MTGYIFRRLCETAGLLLVLSFTIYALIGLMPGDPVDMMLSADPDMTSEDARRLKELYGLDQPLWNRYLAWLAGALHGDFGYSRLYGQPSLEVLVPRLVNTLWLLGSSFVLALAIAIPAEWCCPAGGRASRRHDQSSPSPASPCLPSGSASCSSFSFPSTRLAARRRRAGRRRWWLADRLRYMILPVMTLIALSAGTFVRSSAPR
ncbi:MAG: ABC transporter permease [Geminicoccaceae bacterium]